LIAASFDYGGKMMKQAFLFLKPFAAPGAFTPQQAPSERSLSGLNTFPPSPVSERASKGSRLSLAGRIMSVRRPSVQLIVVIHPINYANGAKGYYR
jgi:hypothetical protein